MFTDSAAEKFRLDTAMTFSLLHDVWASADKTKSWADLTAGAGLIWKFLRSRVWEVVLDDDRKLSHRGCSVWSLPRD